MRLFSAQACILVWLFTAVAFGAESSTVISRFGPESANATETLTNAGVIALADAGFSEAFIVNKILITKRTNFDTTVEGLTGLRKNGIPEHLIFFIAQHAVQPAPTYTYPSGSGAAANGFAGYPISLTYPGGSGNCQTPPARKRHWWWP